MPAPIDTCSKCGNQDEALFVRTAYGVLCLVCSHLQAVKP